MNFRFSLLFVLLASNCLAVTGNQVWRVPNGLKVPSWGPVNLADSTNAVTGTLPKASTDSPNVVISGSSGGYTAPTTCVATDVTNLSVTITTTGRPVRLQMIGASGTSGGVQSDSGASRQSQINFLRGGTTIAYNIINSGVFHGCGAFSTIDTPVAGTYTYKVQAGCVNVTFGRNTAVTRCALVAQEL